MKFQSRRIAAILVAVFSAGAALSDEGPNIHTAAIASLIVDDTKSCGAVPIGATLVMTSAHCVVEEGASEPVHPGSIKLSITAFGAEPEVRQVVDIGTPEGFFYQGIPTRDIVGRDIALLRLSDPITSFETVLSPSEGLTHTAMRTIADGQSYPVEVCETRIEAGNVMALECARAPGSSGSPIFAVIDDQRVVIGVVSAGGERGDGTPLTFATIAQPLFSDITWFMQDRGAITGF